jgi:hypothetical protein
MRQLLDYGFLFRVLYENLEATLNHDTEAQRPLPTYEKERLQKLFTIRTFSLFFQTVDTKYPCSSLVCVNDFSGFINLWSPCPCPWHMHHQFPPFD